jgi:gamma-glutamyltranspeptidase/glutathione hydrolase
MNDLPRCDPRARRDTGIVPSSTAIAVTPHFLASDAAVATIDRGGSAVDGAIAANAVLGVVLPDTCGVGGDLFALVSEPGHPVPTALNASGRCGSGWSAEELRAAGLDHIPIDSPAAITVPGCVDGWLALHKRYGSLPFSTVLEPAIVLATEGFPVSPELAASLSRLANALRGQASAAALYPDDEPPIAGTILRRLDLAATLQRVADDGRDALYQGQTAAAIMEATRFGLVQTDLDRSQAEWVDPVGLSVFGHQAWSIPPNSQGYLTLAAAWIFEQLGPPRDPTDAAYQHALIEAYRSVAWERDLLVSDPSTAPMNARELIAPTRLHERADRISMETTTNWPEPATAPGGTAYFCVRDGRGMGVSFIQSNFHGIGSRISAGASGVFLHDRGAGFNLIPGHPNELQPGRRPLHTLSPTLWTLDGELRLLLGTRGGQYQPQTLLQVAADLMWAGTDAAKTQARARWQLDGWQEGAKPQLNLESRMDPEIESGLVSRGHRVSRSADWMEGWGPVSLILADSTEARGVADPRVSTASVARD